MFKQQLLWPKLSQLLVVMALKLFFKKLLLVVKTTRSGQD